MYKLIDSKNWTKTPAEEVVRAAMQSGASTAEEFSKAFENAGLKTDMARSVGGLIEAHFNLLNHEKAAEAEEHQSLSFGGVPDAAIRSCAALFEKLDELRSINSLVLLRGALKRGATTTEEFAQAFEEQGVESGLARSAGNLAEFHLHNARDRQRSESNANAVGANPISAFKTGIRFSRRFIEYVLFACIALTLLIVPWRSKYHRPLGYSIIFFAPKSYDGTAEIDLARYGVQVFAAVGICGVVYFKTREKSASR